MRSEAARAPSTAARIAAAALALVPFAGGLRAAALALEYRRGLLALHGGAGTLLVVAGPALAALALAVLALAALRARPRPLVLGRALVAALALGTLAWAAALPFRALLAELGLALVLACAAPLALALELGARRRLVRALDFALFQLACLVLGLELALGWLATRSASPLLAQPGEAVEAALARSRMEPGSLYLGYPADERGSYDRPPPTVAERAASGERLVVLIGDSFSRGVVPLPYHYSKVAEERLQEVAIYNMGVAGVGPPEYEVLVREALALEPDLIVLAYFVGNDLGLETPSDPGPLARWLDPARRYVLSVPRHLLALRRERARRSAEAGGPRAVAEVQGSHARLVGLDRAELERELPWLRDPSFESATFSEQAFLEIERQRARDYGGGDPELWAATERQLARLVRAADGVPLALLIVPDEAQVEDALWRTVVAGAEGQALERALAQRRLAAWAAAHGIPCEDLLPRLRAAEPLPDGRRHVYQLRDTHWNARGNALAAEGLAALVERALPR